MIKGSKARWVDTWHPLTPSIYCNRFDGSVEISWSLIRNGTILSLNHLPSDWTNITLVPIQHPGYWSTCIYKWGANVLLLHAPDTMAKVCGVKTVKNGFPRILKINKKSITCKPLYLRAFGSRSFSPLHWSDHASRNEGLSPKQTPLGPFAQELKKPNLSSAWERLGVFVCWVLNQVL